MAELRINAMSGWLSRAKDAFGGREAEVATEPIEIACPCGHKVDATRRPNFQRVLCKNCGEPFFLLPLDVYPRPVMKVRKIKPPPPAVRKKSPSRKSASSVESAPIAAPTAAPARPSIDRPKELDVVRRKPRALFTPLRLIVLSLLVVIGLTGWWQWNRAARSHAEVDFKVATEAGQAALQKQDFVEAEQRFNRAARAVDVLKRFDAPAQQARQRYRHLTVINSLLTCSLPDLLAGAKVARQKQDFAAVESEFASLHAGRWIVLQTEVTPTAKTTTPQSAVPSETATSAWEQRVQVDEEVVWLMASLSIFAKVPETPTAPAALPPGADANANPSESPIGSTLNDLGQREILFAAQVESLKWSETKSGWVLTLKPSSGFLWTDFDLLLAAGLRPDELNTEAHLRALLLEQSRWIGASE